MFVDIENNKSPLAVEVMLFPYKKREKAITPEVCMDVLKSTNYQRSIRDMLNLIAILPESEQANFKKVVLSTFENREQPDDVVILGKKLAVASGYEAQLSLILAKEYENKLLISSPKKEYWTFISPFYDFDFEMASSKVSFLGHTVDLANKDLAKFKVMKFAEFSEVDFSNSVNLPEHIDLSKSWKINFHNCDLTRVKSLVLGDKTEVDFSGAKLPQNIDVSQCKNVDMRRCDLSNVHGLRFREGADVYLNEAIIPSDIDVFNCHHVNFSSCDLSHIKDLKLGQGSNIHFRFTKLPENLDVSPCNYVVICDCDFSLLKKFKYAKKDLITSTADFQLWLIKEEKNKTNKVTSSYISYKNFSER